MANMDDADFWNSVQQASSQEVARQSTQLVRVKVIEYVGLKVNIQREHASAPDDIPYPILDGVTTPAVGDWVWGLQRFGGLVILGRNLLAGSELSKYALKTDLESYLPKAGGTLTGNLTLNEGLLDMRGPGGTLKIRTPGGQHIRMYDETSGVSPNDFVFMDNSYGHFRMYHWDNSAAAYKLLLLINKVTGVASFGSDILIAGKSITNVTVLNTAPAVGWAVIDPVRFSKSSSGIVTLSGRLQVTTAKVADDILAGFTADFSPSFKGMFPCAARDATGLWLTTVIPVYSDASTLRLRIARAMAVGTQIDLAAVTYAT